MQNNISVTRAVLLLQCSRQGWMDSHTEFDWMALPIAEAQALGTVSHKLSEEVDAGLFDRVADNDLFDTVLGRWNELVESVYEQMKTQSLFASPAIPKRWPYYVVKQAAALDRATLRRGMRGEGGGGRRPEVEVFLQSEELHLVGRVDKVEHVGDNVRIVDLKTAQNPGGDIPLGYQYQLALYAAMWHDQTGVLPTAVVIEWQDGSRSYRDVRENDIVEIVQRLSEVRLHIVDANPPEGNASEDICRYCNFRALCPNFLAEDRSTWVRQTPFLVGQVESIIQSQNDRALVVRTVSSQPHGVEQAVVHKFPISDATSVGDYVVFDRLSWRGGQSNFDLLWNSRYRNFGAEPPVMIRNLLAQ